MREGGAGPHPPAPSPNNGRGGERRAVVGIVEEKALDLLAEALGAERARDLIQQVWNLERLGNGRDLRPLLRA